MPLKLTCPNCGQPTRVDEPYPLPGAEVQCTTCATGMAVTYPPGVMQKLRDRGKRFLDDDAPAPQAPAPRSAPPPRATRRPPRPQVRRPAPVIRPDTPAEGFSTTPGPTTSPTEIDQGMKAREVDTPPAPRLRKPPEAFPTARMSREEARAAFEADTQPEATPASGRRAAARPTPAPSIAAFATSEETDPPTPIESGPKLDAMNLDAPRRPTTAPTMAPQPPPAGGPPPPPPARRGGRPRADEPRRPTPETAAAPPRKAKKKRKKKKKGSFVWRWTKRLGCASILLLLAGGVAGGATVGGAYYYYSQELPSVAALEEYRPPTVTEIYDRNGVIMGELYEERRYVTELDDVPLHVRNAFLGAEDAHFYEHGGVDYIGLARAVLNEAVGGSKRQGASTITMQVTRNFLLTRDKTYERKIKEIILSQRIESVYDKDRILWLYLNELYLGSGAYGVEAAARVYFGKHVSELSIAEAALIAGLAPAPSKYSPHKSWEKARTRQEYVLGRMLENEFITKAEHDAALAEDVKIVMEENPFLITAPHFTEHVRRHIMDTYGFERVYNDGLVVHTTMDLSLQQTAQDAVVRQVHKVDQRMGFRRAGLETLPGDKAIASRRAEHEAEMRKQNAFKDDPAGRVPEPAISRLEPGHVYDGVVLEAQKKWVRVGVGDHEAIIPLAWSGWVYEPNPRMSWRHRTASDLTAEVHGWEEGVEKGGSLLRKGDAVLVKVEALSTTKPEAREAEREEDSLTVEAIQKAFRGTPGADKSYVAARLWQSPQVEAATMAFDLETGAVRAMVGGADFEKSEFNRATQARRQVGSTFKPIVYAAAVDTEKMTAASIVPDVRGASYTTDAGFVWKPDNYGDEYLGNITLRKALALSKNTCTIKVLESMDPGMNDDALYTFARKLGIGGPPSYTLGEDHHATPENDHLCPWVRETSESTICMDHYPPRTDNDISNTAHRRALTADDEHWCRACDMSMGLGSASLTMEELLRAYSAFGTGGKLVQPYYIQRIEDRDGAVLEQHEATEFPQVIRPEVATIASWLLQNVVNFGTGAPARRALGIRMGGKTGTTQDYKDTWFVGYSNDVITAAWVGFDEPRTLGVSSTGGRTALPIFIDVMREAAPKDKDRPMPIWGDVEWAQIDEDKGTRVTSGGRSYPFIQGTAPASTGVAAGQFTVEDFTEL